MAFNEAVRAQNSRFWAPWEECDVLISNFDLRQDAREQEIDALKTAKHLLSPSARASHSLPMLFVP